MLRRVWWCSHVPRALLAFCRASSEPPECSAARRDIRVSERATGVADGVNSWFHSLGSGSPIRDRYRSCFCSGEPRRRRPLTPTKGHSVHASLSKHQRLPRVPVWLSVLYWESWLGNKCLLSAGQFLAKRCGAGDRSHENSQAY